MNKLDEFPLASSKLFTEEELKYFLSLLLEEKQRILKASKAAVTGGSITLDLNEMMDEIDLATATIEQNLTFRLLDRDRKILLEVERALGKLRSGEYGYCEGTGEPIPKRRLELAPWTRHSVKHKEHLEKLMKNGKFLEVEEDEDNEEN